MGLVDLLRPAAALHPPQLPCTRQRAKKREQLPTDLLAKDESRLLKACDRMDAATDILLVELALVLLVTKYRKAKLTEGVCSRGFCQY
ncbi:hypothetical protein llap_5277 [Limosa lapponica baueri]|uniref:Uncharacterized protein n=1 Tax=Limosa lapponica baueri TaxID=1758121 RepID=A0A2I0UEC6_LIMLA|nr:hypothetical protein llap_5277 [Limosa lapponica baueri]